VAVLTPIDDDAVRSVASAYGLQALRDWEGVAAGSVNSNFAIVAGNSKFFLRLYEEQDAVGAQRETAVLEHLAGAGVPTPAPLRRLDGGLVSIVRGKPAALFPWRDGVMRCQAGVAVTDAARVGEALARIHAVASGVNVGPGRFRFEDLTRRVDRIDASGGPGFADVVPVLREALGRAHTARNPVLPRGLIHSDLFRDNVLWGTAPGELVALLDFESACDGTYTYDLMVTVLAWCFGDDLDPRLARAMCAGYQGVRPLTLAEKAALWVEGQFAALRFTITRITDYAMRSGDTGPRVVKDWRRFMKRYERLKALGAEGLRAMLDLGDGA
jgi:homoserine kinase type II